MKRFKRKLKKLNNRGSSIVMVIVALAFIGIIVGALLTAAGYAYRLKSQDLNARDNFYYVEQAMNEIYAGVGSETVADMQEAYIYTVEHMVEYDLQLNSYVTKTQDAAEEMFKEQFMANIKNNAFFNGSISDTADALEKYISNDTVKLDRNNLYIDYEYDPSDPSKLLKVTIKNITLTRTQEYSKSVANGTYTQTISTDIVIGEPDFTVLFNSVGADYSNIFKFAMVADMGIEINQDASTPIAIVGNVYASADYYNKKYNESTFDSSVSDSSKKFIKSYIVDGKEVVFDQYTHGSVTSKTYDSNSAVNDYYNKWSTFNVRESAVAGEKDYYNGELPRSMYSGLYIDNTSVSILADTIIVPGSVAVMNTGSLSVYGKDGKSTSEAEMWIDNLILGGYSTKKTTTTTSGAEKVVYSGASAVLRADLYVKDDTELNAAGSSLKIRGSYYGYGDSTSKDDREFIPTVSAEKFQITVTDSEGNTQTENRGHYNSSAIIINGEQSTIDLTQTEKIFLAGRSYIELSKSVETKEGTVTENEETLNTVSETYTYVWNTTDPTTSDPDDTTTIRDYQTGESISVKSNQKAYVPIMYSGMPEMAYDTQGNFLGYWLATLHPALQGSTLFEKYFPSAVYGDSVPCVLQEISGKKYYYYDFATAYDQVKAYKVSIGQGTEFTTDFPSAQYYAVGFITDYMAELKSDTSVIAEYLTPIDNYEDFEVGSIKLPDYQNNSNVEIYSSGALTTKVDTNFNIVRRDDWNDVDSLFASTDSNSGNDVSSAEYGQLTEVYNKSNDLDMEYAFMKWNLGHYSNSGDAEMLYVKDLVNSAAYGDASITPINKFLNFNVINYSTNITPNLSGSSVSPNILDLPSGYSVWISNDDVTVTARSGDNKTVRGMVITKGDVYFDSSVENFEGIVIAGGKVYLNNNVKTMTASAEICRAILRECQLSSDPNAATLLNLFKGYEVNSGSTGSTGGSSTATSTDAKTIDTIDYSDVIQFDNWMKNVE